jgi:four helix bundle protein
MLRIYEVMVGPVREVAPVADRISRRDPDLARQLRKALSSAVLNVAEGFDQPGARRVAQYAVALGSARESWAALETAAAWGYVEPPPPPLRAKFDQVIGTLCRLVRPRRVA